MPRKLRVAEDAALEARLASLAATQGVDGATLRRHVTEVVGSLAGGMGLADLQLYREVETLADYINAARRELAGVNPGDIREQHLSMATDELDAVVNATAEATGTILGAMEEFEKMAAHLPPEDAARITAAVTRVYEACGFQDITGQRITKVVRALRHIESRLDALLAVFGADLASAPVVEASAVSPQDELLNGPALPSSGGNTQDDIDAILASFD